MTSTFLLHDIRRKYKPGLNQSGTNLISANIYRTIVVRPAVQKMWLSDEGSAFTWFIDGWRNAVTSGT